MNSMKVKQLQRKRRTDRVRAKIEGDNQRPRLAVFRSLKHISAQLIDDVSGKTILAATDKEIKADKATKKDKAFELGKLLAQRAKAKKINTVVFDRRDKKYHGRVKAVADGAREAGLDF